MNAQKIRVLCVDDHPLVLEAVTRKIDIQSDMETVAVATDGRQAVEAYLQYRPDVTLMDLQLPVMRGLDAIREIRKADGKARVIVLTMYEGDEDVRRALMAGAATYLLKNTLSDDLVRVVREVSAGSNPMGSDVALLLSAHVVQPGLSAREVQVVEALSKGMRNKEIAAALGIADDTVEAHLRKIFAKLNVNDRTAAVVVAVRRGFIHLA